MVTLSGAIELSRTLLVSLTVITVINHSTLTFPVTKSNAHTAVPSAFLCQMMLMLKWPSIVGACKYLVKTEDNAYVRSEQFTAMVISLPDRPVYGGFLRNHLPIPSYWIGGRRQDMSKGPPSLYAEGTQHSSDGSHDIVEVKTKRQIL